MKTPTQVVHELIDSVIDHIDSMVKRQHHLKKEITQSNRMSNIEFIVKKTEMESLRSQTDKLSTIIRDTMSQLVSFGNNKSDSCECETGKVVDRHHPNCKWMNEIFGDDINILQKN